MNIKKRTFDLIFIIISTAILIALAEYKLLEKYMAFSLIPILMSEQNLPEQVFNLGELNYDEVLDIFDLLLLVDIIWSQNFLIKEKEL